MTKHTYTNAAAPRNTGSASRPARFDLRLTCSDRARTHKVLSDIREMLNLPSDYCYADVWCEAALPALEHIIWFMRESPTATKALMRSLFDRLPESDWVRNRYAELKERLEPKPPAPPPPTPVQPTFGYGEWEDEDD